MPRPVAFSPVGLSSALKGRRHLQSDLPKRPIGRGLCSIAGCARPAQRHTLGPLEEEITATNNFFELFFNLMIGLNNYLAVIGREEPLFSEIPAIIRTNGNPAVDATLNWMMAHRPGVEIDWGREFYLRATYGADGCTGKQFSAAYDRHVKQRTPARRETEFARWWSLITDRAYVEPSSFQFARTWVEAVYLGRGNHKRGRRAQHDRSMSYADLACFFDNFHIPLLPPEIDEQALLETLDSR